MIKVLQIRETPTTKCAGIDSNCQGLISLFEGDKDIEMLPTVDYIKHTDPFIHQCWLDKKEICDSIKKIILISYISMVHTLLHFLLR